jgi:translation initiation factor IF-2
MFNDKGKKLKKAEPATPVEVLGLNAVPHAGDTFITVEGEHQAKALLERRQAEREQLREERKPVTLTQLMAKVDAGKVKELNIVLKTDVQGSIEPIRDSLEKLSNEKIRVKVIHAGSGTITEGDVLLALASKGIIIGFNTTTEPGAKHLAEGEGVEIRIYNIIYQVVEAVDKALKGMIEPTYVDVPDGHAKILATFPAGGGLKRVAGVMVTDGKVSLGALARLYRNNELIVDTKVKSLRRFKDNVNEVTAGFECGVGLENFWEFQIGDILEFYHKERA